MAMEMLSRPGMNTFPSYLDVKRRQERVKWPVSGLVSI
jgi:hypothetical protein